MKYDVFVSYSRRDSAIVGEFVRLLENEGFRVWIDIDGIESGEAFKKTIVRAIKDSSLVLFFSSEFSNASTWTAKEISIAVHYEKPIIPIKIDKTCYNDEVEFDLVNLDYLDYTDSTKQDIMRNKLLRTLRKKLPERWNEICESKVELEREVSERERLEKERIAKDAGNRIIKESSEKKAEDCVEAIRKTKDLMIIQGQTPVVTLAYVLRENDENGPILQETTKENPFVCIFGMHQLLPKFEENLMGMKPGDKFVFHLTPEEGYGERDEAYVMDLDKNMFMQNNVLMDMVKVGAQLMMQTSDGRQIAGIVRVIGDNYVKMDFNHEMAGKHLHFSGEILDVRESTDEDFVPGGCSGCGGDCN